MRCAKADVHNDGYLESVAREPYSVWLCVSWTCRRSRVRGASVTEVRCSRVSGSWLAELSGELVAQPGVLGAEVSDLCAGGVEALAERLGAGALRGGRRR